MCVEESIKGKLECGAAIAELSVFAIVDLQTGEEEKNYYSNFYSKKSFDTTIFGALNSDQK